jgi:GAG-pre-integrase domain
LLASVGKLVVIVGSVPLPSFGWIAPVSRVILELLQHILRIVGTFSQYILLTSIAASSIILFNALQVLSSTFRYRRLCKQYIISDSVYRIVRNKGDLLINQIQTYLGPNRRRKTNKQPLKWTVARRANRLNLNHTRKAHNRGNCTLTSTQRLLLAKIRQKRTQDISKLSTIINYLTQYGHRAMTYALSTKHTSTCTSNNSTGQNTGTPIVGSKKNTFFDTDMVEIKVDTGCSYSMSGTKTDFIPGTIQPVSSGMSVSAYGGTRVPITGKGTLKWTILDDVGKEIDLIIPNSLYIYGISTRLLSPQHYAQVSSVPETPNKQQVVTMVYGDSIVMYWAGHRRKRTIPLDDSNLGTLYSVPGFNSFRAFITKSNLSKHVDDTAKCCIACNIVANDAEDEDNDAKHELDNDAKHEGDNKPKSTISSTNFHNIDGNQHTIVKKGTVFEKAEPMRCDPFTLDINENVFNDTTQVTESILDSTYINDSKPEDLMLLLHYKFGHVSMQRIRRMAERGILPKKLLQCQTPLCQACIYGKMTRRPWRMKPSLHKTKPVQVTKPGVVVSVDQLESPVPGFVAQMKGKLTRQRYRAATIFVDHFSSLSYVHLQQSTSAKETLTAKIAFENYAESFGIKIMKYHADNGRFAENAWRNDVAKKPNRCHFRALVRITRTEKPKSESGTFRIWREHH